MTSKVYKQASSKKAKKQQISLCLGKQTRLTTKYENLDEY